MKKMNDKELIIEVSDDGLIKFQEVVEEPPTLFD